MAEHSIGTGSIHTAEILVKIVLVVDHDDLLDDPFLSVIGTLADHFIQGADVDKLRERVLRGDYEFVSKEKVASFCCHMEKKIMMARELLELI